MAAKAAPIPTAPTPAASTIAGIETELANLAARRETLEGRKDKAVAELAAARNTRKTALAKDPTAELAGLTRTVREGEDELDTISGVLADLAEEEAEARVRLEQAKDQDERIGMKQRLQSVAIAVDEAAAALDKALALVGIAYADLVKAIPETLTVVDLNQTIAMEGSLPILHDGMRPARPNDLARAILAEGITRACPGAMGISREGNSWRMDLARPVSLDTPRPSYNVHDIYAVSQTMTAVHAATALISSRIRARAEDIASGKAPANIDDRPTIANAPKPKPVDVKSDSIEIIATEDFNFLYEEGMQRAFISKGAVREIHKDAAAVAIRHHVALRTDTAEGAAAAKAVDEQRKRRAESFGVVTLASARESRNIGTIRKPAPITINAGAA